MAQQGRKIGLLGGSFDPPHDGHLHLSREALKRLDLDEVWWIVSPGNPLKPHGPAPFAKRYAACVDLTKADPRIRVSDFEKRIGVVHTAQSLRHLFRRNRADHFVWLMGADNLASLHKWTNWRWIIENVPVAVLARPGIGLRARLSPAARSFRHARLAEDMGPRLVLKRPPAWLFLQMPMRRVSSTDIRASGGWK